MPKYAKVTKVDVVDEKVVAIVYVADKPNEMTYRPSLGWMPDNAETHLYTCPTLKL